MPRPGLHNNDSHLLDCLALLLQFVQSAQGIYHQLRVSLGLDHYAFAVLVVSDDKRLAVWEIAEKVSCATQLRMDAQELEPVFNCPVRCIALRYHCSHKIQVHLNSLGQGRGSTDALRWHSTLNAR
jgi:hypothetical protein